MRAVLLLLYFWLNCGILPTAAATYVSQTSLIHTVVPTECNKYQDWQMLGLYWSWQKIGSPGMFTRIACCDMKHLKGQPSINPYQLYYTDTNVDPDGIGDDYVPYNKPYGIMSWLQDVNPVGDYFLIVDADMTFHRSVTAGELGVGPGWGAGQRMWYMEELNEFLAQMLLPSHDQPAVAVSSSRRLLSKQTASAHALPIGKRKDVADTRNNAQAEHSALLQLLQKLLDESAAGARQAGKAVMLDSQPHRAVLQEETEGIMGEQGADPPAAEPVLPLADEVGEFYMYTADDLKAIAPLWWNYTKQMRVFHETHAQELPKDTPIERPWIAEMYAIALGAAQEGIRHRTYEMVMHPPNLKKSLTYKGPCRVVTHYAWNAEVPSKDWKWNKHAFKEWSPLSCPPWDLDQEMFGEAWDQQYPSSQGGLFPHPPMPSELTDHQQDPAQLFEALANIEMVAMLNEAFCEMHHKPYCPPSEELIRECGKVAQMMQELSEYYRKLDNDTDMLCIDTDVPYCDHLNASSDKESACQQNKAQESCHSSCDLCHDHADSSSLVWYNQAKPEGSSHALTLPPGQAHALSELQDGVVCGDDDLADSQADAYHKQATNSADAMSTKHTGSNQAHVTLNTVEQLNSRSNNNHSNSSHAAAAAATFGKLAQRRQASMHVAERSRRGGNIWKNPMRYPLLAPVLCLFAVSLLCAVRLARGAFVDKRAWQSVKLTFPMRR